MMEPHKLLKGDWATVRAPLCYWDGVDVQVVDVMDDSTYMCQRATLDVWPFDRAELEPWGNEA